MVRVVTKKSKNLHISGPRRQMKYLIEGCQNSDLHSNNDFFKHFQNIELM